jgi:hypothetical protein
VLGAPDALPPVGMHAPGIGASAYEMRHSVTAYLCATDFGLSDHSDIDYFADTYIEL